MLVPHRKLQKETSAPQDIVGITSMSNNKIHIIYPATCHSDGLRQNLIELEEVLSSRVFLWRCLRVRRHLRTQFETQHGEAIGAGVARSDWLLLGSLDCVESPEGVRQEGVSVRGQGSNQRQNIIDAMCWHVWVVLQQSDMASFPSATIFLINDINITE